MDTTERTQDVEGPLSEHEWGDKVVSVPAGIEGHGYKARTIWKLTRICTRCGVSRSAAEHFAWDCQPGHEGGDER